MKQWRILLSEITFFHLHLANMSFSSERNCVQHLSFYRPYQNSLRKVEILPELLFCDMAFFHLHLANMSFPSETEIVSTNKIINISKNVGTSHFINIWVPLILLISGRSRARWLEKRPSRKKNKCKSPGVCPERMCRMQKSGAETQEHDGIWKIPVLKRVVNSSCTDSIRSTNKVKGQ